MKLSEAVMLNLREIKDDDDSLSLAKRIDAISRFEPIVLFIDSCGGSVNAANAIAGAIKRHGKVIGFVTGQCNSMALSIFAACSRRLALPHATFHFHSRTWDLKLPILSLENMERVQVEVKWLLSEHERYEQDIVQDMPGTTQEEVRQLCRDETTLGAAQAKELGLVTHIIDPHLHELLGVEPSS